MSQIKYYIKKYKIFILLLIVLVLILGFIIIFNNRDIKTEEIVLPIKEENIEEVKEKVEENEKIKVDIKGMVKTPGVYELDIGSRVIDVINKAGGLTKDANTEYINLSKKITDEMIIIIYSKDEIEKFKYTDKEVIYIEYECDCPDNINDACITNDDTVNTNDTSNIPDDNENTKDTIDALISINDGTLEELMNLDGIGEAKAKAIIEYREKNGKFEKLEDIMNVSGIGEKAYSKIKDNIKL